LTRSLLFLCLAVVLIVSSCPAQSAAVNGSIGGSVADAKGAVVPGAKVTIRNADLNNVRTATSSEDGSFIVSSLPPGNYLVHAMAQGMELKRPLRVTLGLGSGVKLSLKLSIVSASSSVTVTASGRTSEGNTLAPEVNKQESVAMSTIAGLNVTDLPDHVRDVNHFGDLAAGVTPENSNSNNSVIAGQRAASTNAAVDGASIRDPLNGGLRGSQDQALFFPQTVVKEFQIVRSGASADVGFTNAGFLNISTKSGSNKLHGEAFYIGRPDRLSSNDTFGHSLDNAQNEFGGSFGGPIRKNKAFYYVGVEKDYLNTPYWTQFAPQASGVIVPATLLAEQHQIVGKSSPTAFFARTDFNLSSANTLNVSLNYNHARGSNLGFGSTRTLDTQDGSLNLRGDSTWVRANLATVLDSGGVNQFAAQWSDDHRDFRSASSAPEVMINGFGTLGGNSEYPLQFTSEDRRVSDDLSIVHGGHLVHVGGEFAHSPARYQRVENLNGRFDFNSLDDYLAGNIRRFQRTLITGDAIYRDSVRESAFYLTDRWSASKRLTINGGLRWQGQWNPKEGSIEVPNDLSQWQPRLGVAYNPVSNTVLRVSVGLYDAATPAVQFARAFIDSGANTVVADSTYDPQILSLVAGGIPLATVPVLTTPNAMVQRVASNFRSARSFQVAGTMEQQITPRLSFSVGYVHGSTWNLPRLTNVNLETPIVSASGSPVFPGIRPVPTIGQLFELQSSGHSDYNGLLMTGNWQFGKRSNLTANYTFSRSRDNASSLSAYAPVTSLNPFDAAMDRGYSDFDARHAFNLGTVFNLPWGFKVNPLIVAHSGLPYTPIIGFDEQNDGNDWNDRALLSGAISSRNSLRQPSFFNLDLRFVKDITLPGEGHHLDLFMDVLNLTGAANRNFGQYPLGIYGNANSPVYSAGEALFAPDTSHYGGARQVQFTVRLVAF
jgi:hypothetical protein